MAFQFTKKDFSGSLFFAKMNIKKRPVCGNEIISANGIGSGAAYENGAYNEAAKSAYGFQAGQAAYQQRHAAFANG